MKTLFFVLFFTITLSYTYSQNAGYTLVEIHEQKEQLQNKINRIKVRNATVSKKDIYNKFVHELKFFNALESKYSTQTFQYPKKDSPNYAVLKRQWISENGKLY